MDDGLNALWIKLFLFSKIRAENATFNGILIGSVVMTEILVCAFDAVSGPGTVPGPGTASNRQTSISVLAQSSTETPPDSLLDKL